MFNDSNSTYQFFTPAFFAAANSVGHATSPFPSGTCFFSADDQSCRCFAI